MLKKVKPRGQGYDVKIMVSIERSCHKEFKCEAVSLRGGSRTSNAERALVSNESEGFTEAPKGERVSPGNSHQNRKFWEHFVWLKTSGNFEVWKGHPVGYTCTGKRQLYRVYMDSQAFISKCAPSLYPCLESLPVGGGGDMCPFGPGYIRPWVYDWEMSRVKVLSTVGWLVGWLVVFFLLTSI